MLRVVQWEKFDQLVVEGCRQAGNVDRLATGLQDVALDRAAGDMDSMLALSWDASYLEHNDCHFGVLELLSILVSHGAQSLVRGQNSQDCFQETVAGTVNMGTGRFDLKKESSVVQEVHHSREGMDCNLESSKLEHIEGFDLPLRVPNGNRDVPVAAGGQAHRPIALRGNPHFLVMMLVGGEVGTGGEEADCAKPLASNDADALLRQCDGG